ncbi:hypothetical protein CDD80_5719 [Ophiocordyceps camponoti-rufipedis]|uniref:Transcription factor spt8 beta-propeller domain-containing protein n=1 Tax=Ophiocordyceps camponoti-rufipedis TaxID=2004952 RepID=A0A2C5YT54_9HYPO|nr:hypothetical protein CDD80_5719 [Ophiocordyceps camponoti-rufipedis]
MDDEDRFSASSAESERDNEPDETMEDGEEAGNENEQDEDNDEDDDEDGDNDPDGEDPPEEAQPQQDQQQQQSQQQQPRQQPSQPQAQQQHESQQQQPPSPAAKKSATPVPSSIPWRPTVRPEALTAKLYDIVPTMAAPMATSINAMAITPDLRYWITGGSDGYIRKYDGPGTINGKLALTVAQKHPFVDSVTKAGILMSYWENEEPSPPSRGDHDQALSPVYSLAVHSKALWLLSGLESGGINLQSVRHDEGKRICCLQQHTNAVSVLTLAPDEKSVLSGGWDKKILDWDLNTGLVKRSFDGNAGQISSIELRPASGAPVPAEADEPISSSTMASNNGAPASGALFNGPSHSGGGQGNGGVAGSLPGPDADASAADARGQASPAHESLFGGSDAGSLFGETSGEQPFGHDDDSFGTGLNMMPTHEGGMDHSADMAMADMEMGKGAETEAEPAQMQTQAMDVDVPTGENGPPAEQASLPVETDTNEAQTHEEKEPVERWHSPSTSSPQQYDPSQTSATTFLSSAMDGTIRIWDRRVPNPVARIGTRVGVPPWCMSACWSPDGNMIYAGRRNCMVEEFDIRKAKRAWEPERTLRFPAGSGAVSVLKPMVNGRHLVCASYDILRLYDLRDQQRSFKHSTVPFLIIPGPPRAGVISSLYIDPTSRFMLSAAGTRGWEGTCTEALIGYNINVVGD